MTRDAKSIINGLWERLWAGGIANPLTAIEQISYFIFLKRLDQLERKARGKRKRAIFAAHPDLRWDSLKAQSDREKLRLLERELIPFLAEAAAGPEFRRAMKDAAFVIPKASLVGDCMKAVDELGLGSHDLDFQGDIYEELLRQLQLSGRNGQFRTPRHVIRAIVDLVEPEEDDVVCDPAAGTAGFLVEAHKRLRDPRDENFLAFDFDASMVRLGIMNMVLHGIEEPRMRYTDALSSSFAWPAVDVVLANPPFTGSLDREDKHPDLDLPTNRTELLFLELCRRMLRPGGQAAIIVPEGVLFGGSKAHVEVRRRWLRQGVQAVVSLPPGVFRPYTNVKTAILLGGGSPRTEGVWFCPIASDGFTLDDRRDPLPGDNDLAHMAAAVRSRLRGRLPRKKAARKLAESMWAASIAEIEAKEWSLAPATYQQLGEFQASEENPFELLDQIGKLEAEFRGEVDRARAILEEQA
ncbi:MAG TPA: class I SAM-dependent DNA methyltransferase [Solirubrobacterales bacterium]|nr:class I SAM-dependent DNA methyltransferase [Solirubrobacterales bacterium]